MMDLLVEEVEAGAGSKAKKRYEEKRDKGKRKKRPNAGPAANVHNGHPTSCGLQGKERRLWLSILKCPLLRSVRLFQKAGRK